MADFTVIQRGYDTSGRGLFASRYMWDVWDRVVAELGFTPTIVQGAWMVRAGGGAAASAGYHDGGGCFDLRVWDRTDREVQKMVRTLRRYGCGAWVRNERHGGMDPHLHFVLGSDAELAPGAAWQWMQYLAGRDGLASSGPDYHWRPDPIVTEPPEEEFMTPEDREWLDRRFDRLDKRLSADAAIRTRLARVDRQLDDIEKAQQNDANKGQVRRARNDLAEVLSALAEDPDATPRL